MADIGEECSSGNPLLDALVGFFEFLGDPIGTIIKGIADLVMMGALAAFQALTESIPTFKPGESKPAQDQLNWLVVYVAIGSLIFACIRMALERRGESGQTALKGMLRLIVVAGGGTAIVGAFAAVGDDFANHLYGEAIEEQVRNLGCGSSDGIPEFLYLILAFLLLISAVVHGILLYVRLGVMIVLFGTLPLAAAASMTDWGGGWWRKHMGWMIAWLLYKPAAGLVIYAGTNLLSGGEDKTSADRIHIKITGICVMLLSAIALPALLKLIVPATAGVGGQSSYDSTFSAVSGGLASGAKAMASSGSDGDDGSGGGSGSSGESESGSRSKPSGASDSGGSGAGGGAGAADSAGSGGGGSGGGGSGGGGSGGGGSSGGIPSGSGGGSDESGGGPDGGDAPSGASKGAGATAGTAAVAAAVLTAATQAAKTTSDVAKGAIDGDPEAGNNK